MASVQFVGLNELILALMALPEELTVRAGGIVEDAADAVMAEAAGGYAKHQHTGNLAKGLVKVEQSVGRFGVGYQVQNNAPHVRAQSCGKNPGIARVQRRRGQRCGTKNSSTSITVSINPGRVTPMTIVANRRAAAILSNRPRSCPTGWLVGRPNRQIRNNRNHPCDGGVEQLMPPAHLITRLFSSRPYRQPQHRRNQRRGD